MSSMPWKRTIFTAFLVGSAWARADQIDQYVESQLRTLHIPGGSIAIVRDGKIVKATGYGLANIELNARATKDTVYEIGSVTKQFTAAAVMMLVEQGKIALDDKVGKFFPEAPQSWSEITVRHLLTHTSGIQDHVAVPGWLNVFKSSITGETSPSRDELLKLFFGLPLEFQPGETWAYDNTGYYLLGIIIEKASGESYWEFLSDRIFKPLGMTATRSTDPQPIVANRAAGYAWVKNRFENRPILAPFIAFSAGSILSNVEDMAKWDAALYTEKLLKKSSLEQLWTVTRTKDGAVASMNYGFGWFIDSFHGHRLVQHSGGTPGFSSAIYRFIDDKLTVILLTNHSDRILDQIVLEVAEMSQPSLKLPDPRPDPDPSRTENFKATLRDLMNGKYDAASFTPAMVIFLKTTVGQGLFKWFVEHGALGMVKFSDEEQFGDNRVIRYRVELGGNSYRFSCALTRENKIAQIYWW